MIKILKLKEVTDADLKPDRLDAPKPERMLCVRTVEVSTCILAGEPVDVIRLPSGLVLLKLGPRYSVVEESVLLANFVEA